MTSSSSSSVPTLNINTNLTASDHINNIDHNNNKSFNTQQPLMVGTDSLPNSIAPISSVTYLSHHAPLSRSPATNKTPTVIPPISNLPDQASMKSVQNAFKIHNSHFYQQQQHHSLKHEHYPSRSDVSLFNFNPSTPVDLSTNNILGSFSTGPSFDSCSTRTTPNVLPTAIPTPNYSPVVGSNAISPSFSQGHRSSVHETVDNGLPSPPLSFRVGRLKPPMPYPMLLSTCILHAPNQRLTLRQIYEVLMQRYPETYVPCERFRGWQNTVRYNLSRYGVFEKLPRRSSNGSVISNPANTSEPTTKGSWWTIKPEWLKKISISGLDALKNLSDKRDPDSPLQTNLADDTTGKPISRKSRVRKLPTSKASASKTDKSLITKARKTNSAKSASSKKKYLPKSDLFTPVEAVQGTSHLAPNELPAHCSQSTVPYRGQYFPTGHTEPMAILPSFRIAPTTTSAFISNTGGGCNTEPIAVQYHAGYSISKDTSSRQLPLPQPLPDWASMSMFSPSPPYLHYPQQQQIFSSGYLPHSSSLYPNHHNHQPLPPSEAFPLSNPPVYRY